MQIKIPKPASPRIARGPSKDDLGGEWEPPVMIGYPAGRLHPPREVPLSRRAAPSGINDTPLGHRLRED
jgi:hypothetical protein